MADRKDMNCLLMISRRTFRTSSASPATACRPGVASMRLRAAVQCQRFVVASRRASISAPFLWPPLSARYDYDLDIHDKPS